MNNDEVNVVDEKTELPNIVQQTLPLDDDDDDIFADVVLEQPTCTLGEECESCQ